MPTKYSQSVTAFAAVGSLAYGYASSIIAYIIGFPSFFAYMGLVENSDYSNSIIGAANGLYPGGGCCGCLFTAWSGEVFGRKRSMQIGCVIGIVGAILMCAAQNIPMFLVSRFIMGWSIGMLVTLVPLYQSECSPPSHRGLMVGYHGVLIATSYSLAGIVSYACYYAPYGQFQWRFPLGVQLVPVTVLLAGSFFLPRSPRWLLSKGFVEEAWEVTRKLHHDPSNPTFAEEEFEEMKAQIALEQRTGAVTPWGKAKLAFSKPSYRKRLGLGFLLQAGNQSVGNIVINNYQVTLYGTLGITGGLPILLTAMWNVVAIFGNGTCAFFVDRVGRRKFLLVGIAGCLVFLAIETAMVARYVGTDNKAGNAAGVFALFGYIVFYSGGCDVIQYLYAAEIFPMLWRSFGMGFSLLGQWLSNTVYLAVTPTALSAVSWRFFLLFIALGTVYFILVYFFMPETSLKTLEQIASIFGDEVAEDHHLDKLSRANEGRSGVENGEQTSVEESKEHTSSIENTGR